MMAKGMISSIRLFFSKNILSMTGLNEKGREAVGGPDEGHENHREGELDPVGS